MNFLTSELILKGILSGRIKHIPYEQAHFRIHTLAEMQTYQSASKSSCQNSGSLLLRRKRQKERIKAVLSVTS